PTSASRRDYIMPKSTSRGNMTLDAPINGLTPKLRWRCGARSLRGHGHYWARRTHARPRLANRARACLLAPARSGALAAMEAPASSEIRADENGEARILGLFGNRRAQHVAAVLAAYPDDEQLRVAKLLHAWGSACVESASLYLAEGTSDE